VTSRSWRSRGLVAAGVVCLTATAGDRGMEAASLGEVRVRASEAFAPCLAPALDAFTRETAVPARLEVKDPDPAAGADVVVGDDSELRRVLEGGTADLATAFDLGTLPWVFVAPESAPADVKAAAAGADRVAVLGGRLGRRARASLGRLPADRLLSTGDPAELRRAAYALVPRSLAGPGVQRPAGVHPLVAVAAAVAGSANPSGARGLLAFLKSPRGREVLSSCLSPAAEAGVSDAAGPGALAGPTPAYATAVIDWWMPRCSLETNSYTDPSAVLGPPDAVYLGIKDHYTGMMSLGEGGYVTVDMGVSAVDGPGPDVRVFQTTSNEPVTLYAATSPQGPFTLVGLDVDCGERTGGGIFSNHCDFDLHDAGLTEARYFKIEDGEIYPCLERGTVTEGADIDAIQILNQKP